MIQFGFLFPCEIGRTDECFPNVFQDLYMTVNLPILDVFQLITDRLVSTVWVSDKPGNDDTPSHVHSSTLSCL